ncbi:LysR family transcriptional regulator [Roseovarius faecimaris]|uniref:LysR family transcriptional regulator n=1 Tax=Roseovarius faecimaris TaxID=2494550 RepID=A0A6I6IWJ9_9RHOB|nr:LysR family transcriptional regulator [Roseovarius faecimaris]QGX97068.1 LysR family transcriptional regulator [Roseovarius faecimaris]
MSISVRQARYFIAAADFGQVSLAAKELNISQSAVTTAIKQLEETLGVKLFSRVAKGVYLTAEGARFLSHARNIIAAVNEATQSPLRVESGAEGRLKVGLTYTVAGYFMPRHHARFLRSYPQIEIELVELPRNAIEHRLVEGDLDMAVILVSNLRNKKDIAYETLFRSRRRLWLPPGHGLLSAPSVSLADVAREPYIMLTVDEAAQTAGSYWTRHGLKPNISFRTASIEAIRSMVAAGMGVTILSDMVYRPWSLEGQRLETRGLEVDVPTMDVGIAWSKARAESPAAKTLRDFLSTSVSDGVH